MGTGGFSIGDTIVINPGGSTEETNTVDGFGSILLDTPLVYDHQAGEIIQVVQDQATATPTAVMTRTRTPQATQTARVTRTAEVTRTRTPQATQTARVTRTAEPTKTVQPSPDCMKLSTKIKLIVGIVKRYGAEEGEGKYKSKYDVNEDGVIDVEDLEIVAETPTCRFHKYKKYHHDDDD
jgi:hypothetical protein